MRKLLFMVRYYEHSQRENSRIRKQKKKYNDTVVIKTIDNECYDEFIVNVMISIQYVVMIFRHTKIQILNYLISSHI